MSSVLLSRAHKHQLIIPDFNNIIELISEQSREVQERVAIYNPHLANGNGDFASQR